jgi:hypothetical protein
VVFISSRAALIVLILLATASLATAGQALGSIEGTVTDSSGARLPGVTVEVTPKARLDRAIATTTTDGEGRYRIAALPAGSYTAQFVLAGFARLQLAVVVTSGQPTEVATTLEVESLTESVQVVATDAALEPTTSTQAATFSNETLTTLPTASRSYTHVIVAEAGVSAPLPDRTGKGLNIATTPGGQTDDASQSLNPSVNGARPTSNALNINGVDVTNMLNASGSLGNSVGLPLEALDEVEVQTALPSASRGRSSGGNIGLVTRSGTDRLAGTGGYYFQHEKLNANEFFLNRAGVAKPEFRRSDTSATLGGPVLKRRTFFFGAVQRQGFKSGYASNANAATGCPWGSRTSAPRRRLPASPTSGSRAGSRTTRVSRRTS